MYELSKMFNKLKKRNMAKEFVIRKGKLEENGVINVLNYFQDRFEKNDERVFKCSNCEIMHNHRHIYEYVNNEIINICVFCNKKINNLGTENINYRKF